MNIEKIVGDPTSFFRLRSLHSNIRSDRVGLNLVSDDDFFRIAAAATVVPPRFASPTPKDLERTEFATSPVVAFDSEVKCRSAEVGDHSSDRLKDGLCVHHGQTNHQQQEQEQDVSRTIFVGNVSFRATAGTIRRFFKKFGNVKTVFLVQKHGTRSHRRVAFVTFAKMESAKRAIEAGDEDVTMDNRQLRIFPASEKKIKEVSGKECPTEEQSVKENNDDVEEHLVELNDDAMLLIFKYLNPEDLFVAEKVCKRWSNLVAATWASKQILDFRYCFSPFSQKHFSSSHFKKILTHCGPNLKSIDISHVAGVLDSKAIRHIAKMCPNLEELDFSGLHIMKGLMETLGNGCAKLQKVVCKHIDNISEKELWWLVNKCQHLKYLDVSNNWRITAQCFRRIGPNLKVLKLNDCRRIDVAGFKEIADRCLELVELHLKGASKLTSPSLKLICNNCLKITKLHLGGFSMNVDVNGLCDIGKLKHLEELYLSENKLVVDEVLVAISAGCKQLRVLDVSACNNSISDDGVKSLVACSKLAVLNLSYLDNLSDDCLVQLSMSCPLEDVTVRGCQEIGDVGFRSVVNLCPRLNSLDVSGAKLVTGELVVAANNAVASRDNAIKLELTIGGTLAMAKAKGEYHPLLDISIFNYCEDSLMPTYDLYDEAFYGDDNDYYDDSYWECDDYPYDDDVEYALYDDPVMEMEADWLS